MTPAAEEATTPDEEDERMLAAAGVPLEEIRRVHEQARLQAAAERAARTQDDESDDDFELWAWHQDAHRLYCGMRTQWRVAAGPRGVIHVGLDYGPLDSVQRRVGLGDRLDDIELFSQLQVIERAARDCLNSPHPQ